MNQTGVVHNQEVIKGKATGYLQTQIGFKAAYPVLNSELFLGAASLYSTCSDLLKWDQALYSGKLLNAQYTQLMYTPVQNPYGYGWFVDKNAQGDKTVSHGGDIFGSTSLMHRQLATHTVIIILSNVQSVDRDAIMNVLKGVLLASPYSTRLRIPRQVKQGIIIK
jgi:CubicO group peptidase (beta-lactamase class C family)